MVATKRKVKKKQTNTILLVVVLILIVGVIVIQLFWPQKFNQGSGEISRIGEGKPLNPSPQMTGSNNSENGDQENTTFSDGDNPNTTEVIE